MKLHWKITVGLVAVGLFCVFLLMLRSQNNAQKALEETRRALRQQGFKTDLAEFNFSTSAELRARAAALIAVDKTCRSVLCQGKPYLMTAVGSDAALVVWKQDKLEAPSGEYLLPELREVLDSNRAVLDAACEAALSGPIRFNLNASHGIHMLLPHLAVLRNLTEILSTRAVLDLHDDGKDAAWTNLLASTRLVTAWDPEPAEISHLVRYRCAAIAYGTTWQALQAHNWTDDQLVNLQHEWESVDFLSGLPETASFTRASAVATCQLERQQRLSQGVTLKEMLREMLRSPRYVPRYAWSGLTYYWGRLLYRNQGTYDDEKALLLHYQDREIQLRRAVQCSTWSEMHQLPGVTNSVPFRSKYPSMMQAMMNLRQIAMALQKQDQGLLGRAAEAEARRRLIITAIALERYRGRHGSYPKTLQDLVPAPLKNPPTDFMDGKPLHYYLADDGHFVLYSVGLDCIDNGGEMRPPRGPRVPYEMAVSMGSQQGTDLVWPRPAFAAEVKAREEQEEKEKQAVLDREATREKRKEAFRRATVEKLLAMKPASRSKEPTYHGRPLSKVLRNEKALGTTQFTLDQMLTLRQITTGEEPDIATFEVPISYDIVTNIGSLELLVDTPPGESSIETGGELQECSPATNGNCLLVWNTTYDPPGQHALQARFLGMENPENSIEVRGPVAPFFSSNICQFFPGNSMFDDKGAILYAKLPELNGIYTIELKSPSGEHIKTLTGTTSNGVIDVNWDLKDDHGNKYTNDSFESVFNVTLPDSGRSQTQKGP